MNMFHVCTLGSFLSCASPELENVAWGSVSSAAVFLHSSACWLAVVEGALSRRHPRRSAHVTVNAASASGSLQHSTVVALTVQ